MKRPEERKGSSSREKLSDFLAFAVSAINGTALSEETIRQTDYVSLWETAERQKLSSMIAFVVCKHPEIKRVAGADFFSNCEKRKMQQLRKSLLFDEERKSILEEMEHRGIWYIPLKGVLLQVLYPEYGMREMSDVDILYDVDRKTELIRFMEKKGYRHEFYIGGVCDCFYKEPFFNFEFHEALFENEFEAMRQYYADVQRFIVKDSDNAFGFHFSDEDLYVYLICHMYKHYVLGGSGLRGLIDVYLLRKNKNLNEEYINNQLKVLGIEAFEKRVRACGDELFQTEITSISEDSISFLAEICSVSFYGAVDDASIGRQLSIRTNASSAVGKKTEYIIRRLFPQLSVLKEYYPVLKEWPILVPFVYLYRIIRACIVHPAKLIKEIIVVIKLKER